MPVKIDAKVIDALLLGVGGRRRELQDFPVLGDVWTAFAADPAGRLDLLVTPTWEKPTGEVARLLATIEAAEGRTLEARNIAYLQGLVVAQLDLDELVGIALPATKWWDQICDLWEEELHDDIVEEGEGYPTD